MLSALLPAVPAFGVAHGPAHAQSVAAGAANPVSEIPFASVPRAACIMPGPHQVLHSADAFPGRIHKLALDGTVLRVLGRSGKQLKQFGWVPEIACPSENTLFAAELLNWRVQKLELHPGP